MIRCIACNDMKDRAPGILNDICQDCLKRASEEDITLAELKSIYMFGDKTERKKNGAYRRKCRKNTI